MPLSLPPTGARHPPSLTPPLEAASEQRGSAAASAVGEKNGIMTGGKVAKQGKTVISLRDAGNKMTAEFYTQRPGVTLVLTAAARTISFVIAVGMNSIKAVAANSPQRGAGSQQLRLEGSVRFVPTDLGSETVLSCSTRRILFSFCSLKWVQQPRNAGKCQMSTQMIDSRIEILSHRKGSFVLFFKLLWLLLLLLLFF